jgi:hypothetical protein
MSHRSTTEIRDEWRSGDRKTGCPDVETRTDLEEEGGHRGGVIFVDHCCSFCDRARTHYADIGREQIFGRYIYFSGSSQLLSIFFTKETHSHVPSILPAQPALLSTFCPPPSGQETGAPLAFDKVDRSIIAANGIFLFSLPAQGK